ncbi:death domain-containing protein 1 [Synchiropus splendidus]|uniref:death domain-containing protein 1 n=1 Tax=Synchiropus splendidus TaxID=270530 RepID=UPI00237DEE2E|nr:death domain-containing protein 1 [Synchiropus splendidus]
METNSKSITVGLAGQLEDGHSSLPDVCFIKAPPEIAGVLQCEVANDLSFMMVTGSEELVSRVIRLKVKEQAKFRFPLTVVVPYCSSYSGSYRHVVVKIVDSKRRASYITPVTIEGPFEGQRGSFTEVKVYSLGLFAVVSCLKREHYTVPRRGLSYKLPVDPRICLNYLPETFTAPVLAQAVIQPIDAVLLAAVKSRCEAYHWVVSTSPLLYLTHPSSQPLRRPFSITLPCPPNPNRKRSKIEQREALVHHHYQAASASLVWDDPLSPRVRILVPSKENREQLKVVASTDGQWSVLENVVIRNQQNGLVSLELNESFESLLVARLMSDAQPCHLTCLAEQLQEHFSHHSVVIALLRRDSEPHSVLLAAVPARDLSWELTKLQAQGYSRHAETSSEIWMREGDQLLIRLGGNITTSVPVTDQNGMLDERLTFHSQQKNHLTIRLTEMDPFGNHSSPHYKGTAIFYKIDREQVKWLEDKLLPLELSLLGDPVCKLSLTLPKKVRAIKRPTTARLKLYEETDALPDPLLLWLSSELSLEELPRLARALRLRRSTAQLVKLQTGGNISSQAFHLLAKWRKEQPASPQQPKIAILAQCLTKSGRPDLARELLQLQSSASK